MKTARWLAFSLGLNALLLALQLYRGFERPQRAAFFSEITNRTIRVIPEPSTAIESRSTGHLEVIQSFHWSQLESEDYRVYAANLRALGCPEATVRDIMSADVNELYCRRVNELVAPAQSRFWELMANPQQFQKLVEEKEKELSELNSQRKTLLQELLGKNNHRSRSEELGDLETREASKQLLDFLDPAKMAQCLELDEKFAAARQQLGSSQPPLAQNDLRAKLKQLQEKQDHELEQVFSPDEMAEYRLRKSGFADLRRRLPGFQATGDELKQLVQIQQDFAATNAFGQQQQRDRMKDLLGPERFTQFERAQNPQYQEFYQVAERFEMPSQAIADAYEMRKIAEEKAGDVRGDKGMSPEDRMAALKAIHIEIDRALETALGAQAFAIYRSRSGQWLDQLEGGP
jgi:hypothetical protein